MTEPFEFEPASWLPFRDKASCRKVRAIRKDDLLHPENPNLDIEVIPDAEFPFRLVMHLFLTIREAMEAGRRLVLIMPQPEPRYAWVAEMLNAFQVDCHNLYTFNMDEYADQDNNLAPESWSNSFLHQMKKNFYSKLDETLRPPEMQIQGPTDENWRDYGKMIDDLGGADVCFGGIGWSGHIAFVDPDSESFPAVDLEEFKTLGPGFMHLSPFSTLQCCLGPEFGQSGDWSAVPPKGFTIGPAQVLGAKRRSSWNGFAIAPSKVSWQRFTVRLALFGPVTPRVPASLLQLAPSDVHLTETLAEPIEDAVDFSWYEKS